MLNLRKLNMIRSSFHLEEPKKRKKINSENIGAKVADRDLLISKAYRRH